VVGYFGTSWLRPVLEAEELWRVAYASGLETGDLFHTGCACCATTLSYFMRGAPMDEILRASDEYLELLQQVGLDEPGGAVLAVRQAVKNLQGRTRSRVDFTDHSFDEREFVGQLATYGSRHFANYYFVVKMQTSYLWGDLESALDTAEAAKGYLKDSTGMLHSAEHRFYHALIIAGALTRSGSLRRRVSLSTLRRLHRLLRRWAAQCPHNFLHRERLVAGELARISGGRARAEELYLEARTAAAMSGHPHIEALAHRMVSESMRDRDPLEAERHLRLACDLYRRWGATTYAEALENGTIAKENQS
jgi:hypothetical protein